MQVSYILVVVTICLLLESFRQQEFYNAITAFLVIDISSTERNNLNLKEKPDFYNTITTITRANVCGFIAPLLYIFLFGNWFAVIYTLVYNCSFNKEYKLMIKVWTILTIIPSLILQMFLYLIHLLKNKEKYIDYKGEYVGTLLTTPLLNADVLAAYVESVNFYYYFRVKGVDYIKCYGKHNRNIGHSHIRSYLSTSYFICLLCFLVFISAFIIFKTY